MSFTFLGYDFDYVNATAYFHYLGADGTAYQEVVKFKKPEKDYDHAVLERTLFLAFILIGTSYYKAHPTCDVVLMDELDAPQAEFFSTVYQEGLSQFAFENHLTRADLATFRPAKDYTAPAPLPYAGKGQLVLESGGKDSLLTATLLTKKHQSFTPVYVSTTGKYPKVIDELSRRPVIITRQLDLENLKKSGGKNGHVPATYIVQTLALIQAVLDHKNHVSTSIGREGEEPSTVVGDLPINHQWSKTAAAEKLYNDYLHRYVSKDLSVSSPLRAYSELEIAEQFATHCWDKYGDQFSSCNVANYKQGEINETLSWCGKCAKCANSYLLFCPFVPAEKQQKLFSGRDLFTDPDLSEIFKGLLGLDNVMKPFECVGTTAELRAAYSKKLPGYGTIESNG